MTNRSDLIRAVKNTGSHWFDKSTMDWFNSHVENRDVMPVDRERGLWVFLSSDQINDDTFRTEAEARAYVGDNPDLTVFHEAPAGLTNGDGSQASWWVVRWPRWYTVHTVNTDLGISCIDSPDNLNNDGKRHSTRASAWAVAVGHAQAWHEMNRQTHDLH